MNSRHLAEVCLALKMKVVGISVAIYGKTVERYIVEAEHNGSIAMRKGDVLSVYNVAFFEFLQGWRMGDLEPH